MVNTTKFHSFLL